MPQSSRSLLMVQWPLILLENKIQYAIESVAESDSQEELWNRISRDVYMKYAVKECFCTVKLLLNSVFDGEGKLWVERIYEVIEGSIRTRRIYSDFQLRNLGNVIKKVAALLEIMAQKEVETPELKTDAVKAAQDLYDVIMGDFLGVNMRDNHAMWKLFLDGGRLFSELNWPTGPDLRSQIKRIQSLFTLMKYQEYVPRNPEARRRLEYFTNSLFMSMPKPVVVPKILAFSVFTPYYKETVLYSKDELIKDIGQGTTLLVYLHNTYPDEWKNFLARMGLDESTSVSYFLENPDDKLILELRFWASYRGQTLARTVRGMMYNRQALILQSYMESVAVEDLSMSSTETKEDSATETENFRNFQFQCEARAYADLKFTYVITCQLYSEQKKNQEPQAADIALLLQRNEALRVAFIDAVDINGQTKFFSKLVKGDISGNEKEVYSIELPGQFKLGEGKPENQNHAIVFTRGNAVQTIDMNQDNYFEETLKMRNLLQEFHRNHGIRPATILGVREHIYTERASSVASFMSKHETSLVTIAQRVLANPLKVRMHYGHPDVFDRVFHITRGGISKASRGINISEDIYAGTKMPSEYQQDYKKTLVYAPKIYNDPNMTEQLNDIYRALESRNLNTNHFHIQFVINNRLFNLSLEQFAELTSHPNQGICFYSDAWGLDELEKNLEQVPPHNSTLPALDDIRNLIHRRTIHEKKMSSLKAKKLKKPPPRRTRNVRKSKGAQLTTSSSSDSPPSDNGDLPSTKLSPRSYSKALPNRTNMSHDQRETRGMLKNLARALHKFAKMLKKRFKSPTYINLTSSSEEHQNKKTPSSPPRKKSLSPPQAPSKSISSKSTHYTSSSSLISSSNDHYVSTMDNWPPGPSKPSPPPRVTRPLPGFPHPPSGFKQLIPTQPLFVNIKNNTPHLHNNVPPLENIQHPPPNLGN
nr:callose synthase 9 [Tanacetum cinerariifolium]